MYPSTILNSWTSDKTRTVSEKGKEYVFPAEDGSGGYRQIYKAGARRAYIYQR